MLNLIARWKSLFEISADRLLEIAKKNKAIKSIPSAPKLRLDMVKDVYKKNDDIIQAMQIYEFFKKVPELEKLRENEFRKNFCLKVLYRGEWIVIDLDKLKEYSTIVDKFISYLKQTHHK